MINYVYDNEKLDRINYDYGEYKEFDFDSAGRLKEIKNQEGDLVFTYNSLDRLTQIQDKINNQTIDYEYYKSGRLKKTSWDNKNKSITYVYNKLDQLESLIGPEGKSSFTYDTLGRETSRTLPNGNSVTTDYYSNEQTRSIITKNSANEIINSVGYITNASGNVVYELDHTGRYTHYTYDTQNHIANVMYPFGQGKEILEFENRQKAGLFPGIKVDESGPDLYNDPSAVKLDIKVLTENTSFNKGTFKKKIQKLLKSYREIIKYTQNQNTERGTWNITPGKNSLVFVK